MKIGNAYRDKIEIDESLPWPKEVPYLKPSDLLRNSEGFGGLDCPHCLTAWMITTFREVTDTNGRKNLRKGVTRIQGLKMEEFVLRALTKQMGLMHPNRCAPRHAFVDVREANDNEENHKRSLSAAWNRAMHKDLGYTEFV